MVRFFFLNPANNVFMTCLKIELQTINGSSSYNFLWTKTNYPSPDYL